MSYLRLSLCTSLMTMKSQENIQVLNKFACYCGSLLCSFKLMLHNFFVFWCILHVDIMLFPKFMLGCINFSI